MSSRIGRHIRVQVFGESHGAGVGAVVEGLPAGMVIDQEHLEQRMAQRRPGGSALATPRNEVDAVNWLSGVLEGKLTGAPLTCFIGNQDTRSKDYKAQQTHFRPSHADFTASIKYGGFNDPRGGGHFSARLTAPLVAVGALCEQFLKERGIAIESQLIKAGEASADAERPKDMYLDETIAKAIERARDEGDSIGGEVLTQVTSLPVGLGSPMFDSVESNLSAALFGIPGLKAVAFGAGTAFASMKGSVANDQFCDTNGVTQTKTNHSGGINGGITNGMPVVFKVTFRPTSSIAKPQMTLNFSNRIEAPLEIVGRHDPCIALRGVCVVRAVTAIVIADLYCGFLMDSNKTLKVDQFAL